MLRYWRLRPSALLRGVSYATVSYYCYMHDILDLTEGDKLAFLVVELHVGPMRSGNKIRYLLCAAKFVFSSSVSFYVGGMSEI